MIIPLTPVRFKRHAARVFGGKLGVVCEDLRFTYREFDERCDRLSDALVRLGLRPGERVACLSFNCHRLLEAYYGVPQIGAVLLPLNVRLSPEEIGYILNDSSPRLLLFEPEFIPLLECLRAQVLCVEHFISLGGTKPHWAHPRLYEELVAAAEPREIDYRAIDENSVAELFYTSGTTAHPKGVMLTHRNLYLHALYAALGLGGADADVHLYTVALFHANSWGAPHILTLTGARHVMVKKFDPLAVLELVQRERVTRLHVVPTVAIALINHPDFGKYDLSSVREVMLGGAPASAALATIDEEGYILIVDRVKDMVLSGGENIASAEIERVLYDHPAILECAVIAVPDDTWGEAPKALITLRCGQHATETEILEHCRKH